METIVDVAFDGLLQGGRRLVIDGSSESCQIILHVLLPTDFGSWKRLVESTSE
jgi:hypothetical protein